MSVAGHGASDRWERADVLFAAALEIPPGYRTRFLVDECGDDDALYQTVISLLDASDRAAGRFSGVDAGIAAEALAEQADTGPNPEERIGPYRLTRVVGRGGMGTVYEAERSDEHFSHRVALKILRAGLDTSDIVRRFVLERQVLARLNHPNIAILLDGGATPTGRPYFVMEYVEGTRITDYSVQECLTLEARIRLFLEVASAVQHAHQNLVVHRDLKPSNILVTGDGHVKLLDFGISKLLDPELAPADDRTRTGQTPLAPADDKTRTGQTPLTPAYASPEQVDGGPITTATDVYQLGLVLYELLTGSRPQRPTRTAEGITGPLPPPPVRPRRPSDAVAPHSEHGPSGNGAATALPYPAKRLRGDLDTIVLKALRTEPERRYASAAEFADDLRRHLDGLPVAARPDSWPYRLSRFQRRNRWAAPTAAIVAAVLGSYLWTLQNHARELERERDVARLEAAKATEVQAFLSEIFAASDPDEAIGDEVTARELLDRGARRIRTELAGQPEIRASLLAVMSDVHRSLGLSTPARTLADEALAARIAAFGPEDPRVAESLRQVAGLVREAGDYAAADSMVNRALTIDLQAEGLGVADDLQELALIRHYEGRYAEADSLLEAAVGRLRDLTPIDSLRLAVALHNRVDILRRIGAPERAEAAGRETLAIRIALHGEQHSDVAYSHNALGQALSDQGRFAEARAELALAVDIGRRVYGTEHPFVAQALNDLALRHRASGDFATAEPLLREALDVYREMRGPDSRHASIVANNLALTLRDQGHYSEAEDLYRELIPVRRRSLGERHPSVGVMLYNLASVLHEQDEFDEAEQLYREVLSIDREALGEEHPEVGVDLAKLATLLRDKGAYEAAERSFTEALETLRAAFGEGHLRVAEARVGYGGLLCLQGRHDQGEPLVRSALEVRERALEPSHWQIAEAESWLGVCLTARGASAEAARLLEEALESLESTRPPGDPLIRKTRARVADLYAATGSPTGPR